jgi:hypothetical protein
VIFTPTGRALIGRLFKIQYLELVKLDGAKVIGRQKIATDIGRYVMWRKGRTVSFIWGRRKGNSKNYTQLKHLEKSPRSHNNRLTDSKNFLICASATKIEAALTQLKPKN